MGPRFDAFLERVGAVDTADLAARLTLLALLLEPIGSWALRPGIIVLAAIGTLSTAARRHALTWFLLAGLTAYRVIDDWPMADNHAYLLVYWCLALALARLFGPADRVLRLNARWMLGLVFALAVLWKALLSPDYVDGTFFRVTFLTDDRFAELAILAGEMSRDDLEAARDALRPLPPGASLLEPRPLPESPRLQQLAIIATWGTLIVEAFVALGFLVSWRVMHRWRDFLLQIFCAVTYPLAPVFGFGWLLLAMGVAQCEEARKKTRLAYLAVFVLLIVLHDLPWADVLVERGVRL